MPLRISLDGGESFFELDPESIGFEDALTVERHLGNGLEWLDFLNSLSPDGKELPISQMAKLQILGWLAQRETNPSLAIADVNTPISKFSVEGDEEEAAAPLASASAASSGATSSSSMSSTESNHGSGTA